MPTAIIYCRTSRDDDSGESKSIPEQVADCVELAKQQKYSILAVVKEPNRSGRLYPDGCKIAMEDQAVKQYSKSMPHKTRQGLAEVIAALPKVDFIVVRDRERLARPLTESLLGPWLTQQLQAHSVKVHSIKDGIQDPKDSGSLFVVNVQAMALDLEIKKRRENSQTKLTKRRDEGYLYTRPTMLGYRSTGKQTVSIIQAEAHVVREIFRLADKGVPFNQIAKTMNEKRTEKDWTVRDVLKILDRPSYFGLQTNSRGRIIRSEVFPPIVDDPEIYKRIQKRRAANRKGRGHRRDVCHPLSGLLVCGFCGRSLLIHTAREFETRKKLWYYQCARSYSHTKGKEALIGCRMARIPEWTILNLCRAFLVVNAIQEDSMTSEDLAAQQRALEGQLSELKQREDRLVDSDLEGEQIKRQLRRVAEQIAKLESELADLSKTPVLSARMAEVPDLTRTMMRLNVPANDDLAEQFGKIVEQVKVWAFAIDIKLIGHPMFRVERVPDRSSRYAPYPMLGFEGNHRPVIILPYKSCYRERRAKILDGRELRIGNWLPVRRDGGPEEWRVKLYNDLPRTELLNNAAVRILSIGENPRYGERKKKRGETVKALPRYVLESANP